MKIGLRGGFYAINAIAHFNFVKVHFHYPFFAPENFDQHRKPGLKRLSG